MKVTIENLTKIFPARSKKEAKGTVAVNKFGLRQVHNAQSFVGAFKAYRGQDFV